MGLLTKSVKKGSASSALTETSSGPEDNDLVRAGALLARERNFKDLVSIFVEQAQDISHVDLAAFYILKDSDDRKSDYKLSFKRGRYTVPDTISGSSELVCFLRECKEALIFNNKRAMEKTSYPRKDSDFLKEVLIHPDMKSGMALPIVSSRREIGILFTASLKPCFFNRRRFHFLDSYTKLAAGAMQNLLLFEETRE
jgi:GAF domain-containing protein